VILKVKKKIPRAGRHAVQNIINHLCDFEKDRIIDMREAGFRFAIFPKEWIVVSRSRCSKSEQT
jgi:hypothetical protein